MQKISVKNIVLVLLLSLILIGLIYINGQVFIQGGTSVLALEQNKIKEKISTEFNESITFIDRYALDEVIYVYQGATEFYYVNAEATLVTKVSVNQFIKEEWEALIDRYGLQQASIRHGFYKEPVVALVDQSNELVFSLKTKTLLFRHER